MFNEPTRRVNLAGRNSTTLHSNRSTLLEQSRREREQRQQQKQQQTAAVRIQAAVRAHQHNKRRKEEQRQLFDALLPRTIAQYKQPQLASSNAPSSSSPVGSSALSELVLCIRQFLFFYNGSTASDRQRWTQVQQLLTLSLREPQPSPLQPSNLHSSRHYSSLLLLSPSHHATWRHQVSRIAALLLADISQVDSNEAAVAGSVLLLFQLFSAQQWSVYPNAKTAALFAPLLSASLSSSLSSLQQSITAAQLHVLTQLVYVQPSLAFRPSRFRFGLSTPAVSWHAALRARLLQLTELGATASSVDGNEECSWFVSTAQCGAAATANVRAVHRVLVVRFIVHCTLPVCSAAVCQTAGVGANCHPATCDRASRGQCGTAAASTAVTLLICSTS